MTKRKKSTKKRKTSLARSDIPVTDETDFVVRGVVYTGIAEDYRQSVRKQIVVARTEGHGCSG